MLETIDTERFYRVGNNLSVDFVNTLIADAGEKIDLLGKTGDLAIWSAAMNLVENAGELGRKRKL